MMTKPAYVAGVMSGTSLDGIDIALCSFNQKDDVVSYHIEKAKTYSYTDVMKKRLQEVIYQSAYDFVKLDVDLGNCFADAVNTFLQELPIKPLLIASHGHTTFHRPSLGITSQIGSGAVIAAKTGFPVVCDFRSLDVALGGQGAPLVPIGDRLLFGNYAACLNLGGFSNISYQVGDQRIAYDVAPCNMILNHLSAKMGFPFDKDGKLAQSGKVNKALLLQLNDLDYYAVSGAKSLGKEWFDSSFLPIVAKDKSSLQDKLCTVTEHVAMQVSRAVDNLQRPLSDGQKMLVTGGGTHNVFLLNRIKHYSPIELHVPENEIVDFKEALIFAFLGLLRYNNEINCLSSVTGASKNCCGGAVYLP